MGEKRALGKNRMAFASAIFVRLFCRSLHSESPVFVELAANLDLGTTGH